MLTGAVLDAVLGSGALDAANVVLQGADGFDQQQQQFDPTTQAASGFVSTLIVGAIMLAVAPNYVDSIIDDVREEPVASFAWGILALIGFVGVVFLLAITVVGIVLVIPLVFAFAIVAVAGNVLAWLAVCDGFTDGRWVALVVAALVAAVAGLIPVVGGIVGFVTLSVGMGAVVRRWVQ